jgi:hypothetical protein
MGWGVADDETFEYLIEERLNHETYQNKYDKFEILNFSVSGYTTLQSLMILENKVMQFEPDAVIYIAHPNDEDRVIEFIIARVREGVDIPYDELQEIVDEIGLESDTPETTAKRKLRLYIDEIITWAYNRMVTVSNENGVKPIFIIMPRIVGIDEPGGNQVAYPKS